MDKFYTKKALGIKAVYSALLSPLFMLLSTVFIDDNFIVYFMIAFLPVGCLFTVPFWLSLSYIRKYRVCSIRRYVLCDAISCLAPAILGILFSEIVYTFISQSLDLSGFFTLIFTIVFTMISGVFWLMYLIFSRI